MPRKRITRPTSNVTVPRRQVISPQERLIENNTLDTKEHPSISFEQKGKLHLDLSKLDPTKQYCWFVEYVQGYRHTEFVQSATDRGWEFVKQHELSFIIKNNPDLENFLEHNNNSIVRRFGQVLMKRPLELKAQEDEALNRKNRDLMQSVDYMSSGMTDNSGLPFQQYANQTKRSTDFYAS